MEVLRRCPLAIAQQLVYYAIAVSSAVRSRQLVVEMKGLLPHMEEQLGIIGGAEYGAGGS